MVFELCMSKMFFSNGGDFSDHVHLHEYSEDDTNEFTCSF